MGNREPWQSRDNRSWPRRMATLNATTEALDAVVTLVRALRQASDRASAALVGVSFSTSALFFALRAAAS